MTRTDVALSLLLSESTHPCAPLSSSPTSHTYRTSVGPTRSGLSRRQKSGGKVGGRISDFSMYSSRTSGKEGDSAATLLSLRSMSPSDLCHPTLVLRVVGASSCCNQREDAGRAVLRACLVQRGWYGVPSLPKCFSLLLALNETLSQQHTRTSCDVHEIDRYCGAGWWVKRL